MSATVSHGVAPSRRVVLVVAMVVALLAAGIVLSKSLAPARAGGIGTKETVTGGGSVAEGDLDHPGQATFSVTASGLFLSADTVHVKTVAGTATEGEDYVKVEKDLTFSGAGSQSVVVPFIGDDIAESDEAFSLQISGGSSASPTTATATITNDDYNLKVTDVTVTEGTGTDTNAPVVITLSGARSTDTVVNYITNNGTAKAGEDYTTTTGSTTIPHGATSVTVNVPIKADTKFEDSESFGFTITSGSAGATVPSGNAFAVITIQDNDAAPPVGEQPSFSITDATITEGNTGTAVAKFNVNLSAESEHTQTVKVATADSSAKAPGDYIAKNVVLTFAPHALTQPFEVTVNADTLDEANETFTATLSDPGAGAKLTDDVMGLGTITDDDATPTITVANVTTDEGSDATFTIALSTPSGRDLLVEVGTEDDTAKEPGDYTKVPFTTTVLIHAGAPSATFAVKTITDTVDELNETFKFDAAMQTDVPNQFGTPVKATGTITDKSATPGLSVADLSKDEGDEGTTDFVFPVTMTGSSSQSVTVAYATSNGDTNPATAPTDYTAATGTLTFAPGETNKTITVVVKGDTDAEENETFKVTLTSPQNAALQDGSAVGTIKNDDDEPLRPQFITTGAGAGAGSHVREFDDAGAPQAGLFPFSDGPGVRVARGDLDGDGHDELIVAAGSSVDSVVKVYTPDGLSQIATVNAYPGFTGGVFVAAGDVDGDGKDEVITGAGPGGGPHVRTFALTGPAGAQQLVGSPGFMAADTTNGYSGGVTVAAGDLVGNGRDQIVIGLASNGPPLVATWGYAPSTNTATRGNFFLAYSETFRGGIAVAAGDLDGDGKAEIVTGAGPGGGPHVRVFNAGGSGLPGSAFAYDPGFRGGVNVAVGDVDGDGANEIITAAGPGGGPHVRTFDELMNPLPTTFFAYSTAFLGGVYVAVGAP